MCKKKGRKRNNSDKMTCANLLSLVELDMKIDMLGPWLSCIDLTLLTPCVVLSTFSHLALTQSMSRK